ncbi:NUDIX hydrolase [Brevibacillus daliensis]|uniref:NUDIX hydrolase n=1 Tax=Brevibacillus daliensis TaxID=2892995 RepID=UPI001E4F0811|nr:8-oxo-dGTP diphosphatase [Brevibacillus daliensis]
MYQYTLCFIKKENQLLMLNRKKTPLMGLWHGVGGKIEKGETPLANIIREIYEETDLAVEGKKIIYKGIVTWNNSGVAGGMYLFMVEMPADFEYQTPKETVEGTLDWKDISWVLDSNNRGIAPQVFKFLPVMLEENECFEHVCTFDNGILLTYEKVPLA